MNNSSDAVASPNLHAAEVRLLPCPFCGEAVRPTERPGMPSEPSAFLCFIACMCGGFSARAHQFGGGKTPQEAKAQAGAAWNRRASDWQPIGNAPVTEPMKHVRVLCWSKMLGVCVGDLHRWKGHAATVNVGGYHGDAVEHWGVTHWRYPPNGPEQEGQAEGQPGAVIGGGTT